MNTSLWLEARAPLPRESDWLAPGERERLAAMRFPRRRHDFRRGRWTAKRALARTLRLPETSEGLSELEVCADDRGAPYARRRGERVPCDLSLSHRAGAALCAIGSANSRIGCDIEWVEPRSRAFALHFLTAGERGWLESLPTGSRAEASNLLWSAKESVVKALGTGLDIDVRRLSVQLSAEGRHFAVAVPCVGETLRGRWGRHEGWLWTLASPEPLAVEHPNTLRL